MSEPVRIKGYDEIIEALDDAKGVAGSLSDAFVKTLDEMDALRAKLAAAEADATRARAARLLATGRAETAESRVAALEEVERAAVRYVKQYEWATKGARVDPFGLCAAVAALAPADEPAPRGPFICGCENEAVGCGCDDDECDECSGEGIVTRAFATPHDQPCDACGGTGKKQPAPIPPNGPTVQRYPLAAFSEPAPSSRCERCGGKGMFATGGPASWDPEGRAPGSTPITFIDCSYCGGTGRAKGDGR